MNIKTFKESLPFLIEAQVPAMLVGHHGIGKTEGTRQYATEEGHFLRILNLGTQEVGDIIGLADFLKDEKGQNIATKFMMPDWAKELLEFCQKNPNKIGILFLDEINRARRDVLQIVFPLLLEKRIHTTVFPKNFYVLAAMNPNTEDYIVTDISDKALLDRFCHIKLAPSKQEFFEYAKKSKVEHSILQFLTEQPALLQAELEGFDLDVKPSRRSWIAVDRMVKAKTPLPLLRELAGGLVGTAASTAYIKSLSDTDKPIYGKDIVSEYSKYSKKIVEYSNAKTGGRQDIIKVSCDSLLELIQGRKEKFTVDEEKNVSEFLLDIPKELAFNLCREMYMEEIGRPVIDKNKKLLEVLANGRGMKVEGINK